MSFSPSLSVLKATSHRYSLKDGASFAEQARDLTFDLVGDEASVERQRHNSQLKWDKKKKKFIKGDGAGADNMKIVKTEGGSRLPATYRSGRFDEWKEKTRTHIPRVGEAEADDAKRFAGGNKRFKHNSVTSAKPLDKLSKDYERKLRQYQKKGQEAGGDSADAGDRKDGPKNGKRGKALLKRHGGKPAGRVKSELKSAEQIRRARELVEKRKAKNARPTRKKGRR